MRNTINNIDASGIDPDPIFLNPLVFILNRRALSAKRTQDSEFFEKRRAHIGLELAARVAMGTFGFDKKERAGFSPIFKM